MCSYICIAGSDRTVTQTLSRDYQNTHGATEGLNMYNMRSYNVHVESYILKCCWVRYMCLIYLLVTKLYFKLHGTFKSCFAGTLSSAANIGAL